MLFALGFQFVAKGRQSILRPERVATELYTRGRGRGGQVLMFVQIFLRKDRTFTGFGFSETSSDSFSHGVT